MDYAGRKVFKLSLAVWPQTDQSQSKSGAPRISEFASVWKVGHISILLIFTLKDFEITAHALSLRSSIDFL